MYRLRALISTSVCKRVLHLFSLTSPFTQCLCSCAQRSEAAAEPGLCERLRSCQGLGGGRPAAGGGSRPTVGGGATEGASTGACPSAGSCKSPQSVSWGQGTDPQCVRGPTLGAPHFGPQSACPPSQLLSPHNRSSLMPKKDREVTEPPSRAHLPVPLEGAPGAS